jgi:hypothetical protein
MKTYKKAGLYILAVLVFSILGCKETSKEKEVENEETINKIVEETSQISIEKLEDSPAYETASLELKSPDTSKQLPSGEVNFEFNVQNYELGAQTDGTNANRLANSGKGQHIHFILNNEPYSAHYTPEFKKEIPDGTHHLVAFLSRSYHESVKNENSVVVTKLKVGENSTETGNLDIETPTLIYSRPKGEYAGKDDENILLDFFVLNTTLSEQGNKVRATINGEEFIITEWVPHIIKGLPMGEVTIKLELLDDKNILIPGPFNEVTRKVMLKE